MEQFDASQQGGGAKKQSHLKQIIGIVAVVLVVGILLQLRGGSRGLKYASDGTALSISYGDFAIQVVYDEIAELILLEQLPETEAVEEKTAGNYRFGTYQNDEWGTYSMFISDRSSYYIAVRDTQDEWILLNWSSTQDTKALYEGLLDVMQEEEASEAMSQ